MKNHGKPQNIQNMTAIINDFKINLIAGDITKQKTDAIVNAANSTLMGGGGVDGAIHENGGPVILDECKIIRKTKWTQGLPTGEAVLTSGGRLNAKIVIHTVGPVWKGGGTGEPELLSNAYRNCLSLSVKLGVKTISFPSISTGAYGYPVDKACRIALRTVLDFLKEHGGIEEVCFVLHSQHDFNIYEETLKKILRY